MRRRGRALGKLILDSDYPKTGLTCVAVELSQCRINCRESPPLNTFETYSFNGFAVLRDLVAGSPYQTIEQVIASMALFSHPETVAQTACKPLFHVIRSLPRRGQIEERDDGWVAYDDNKSPTDAFLWCNGLSAKNLADVQFNHVYTDSQDPAQYSSLANLCVTPAFLAKLTDTHSNVRALLQYRVFELYGWAPPDQEPPNKPSGYEGLRWAPPLPQVTDVASTVRAVMKRRPKDRTVQIVRRIGWLFSDYCPEPADAPSQPDGHPAGQGEQPPTKARRRPAGANARTEKARLRALAQFADRFSDDNFRFDEMVTPPWRSLTDEALAFLKAVEDHGWIVPFDWQAWADTAEGQGLLGDPDKISGASSEQLSNVLTSLVRKERFSEGTLSRAFECGLLGAIVRRAAVLLEQS